MRFNEVAAGHVGQVHQQRRTPILDLLPRSFVLLRHLCHLPACGRTAGGSPLCLAVQVCPVLGFSRLETRAETALAAGERRVARAAPRHGPCQPAPGAQAAPHAAMLPSCQAAMLPRCWAWRWPNAAWL